MAATSSGVSAHGGKNDAVKLGFYSNHYQQSNESE